MSRRPPPRPGPRPLPLHLGLVAMRALAALGPLATPPVPPPLPSGPGWPSWNGGLPRSRTGREAAGRIAAALAAGGHPPEAFRAAVLRALRRQDAALLAGLVAYRRHPWRRDMPEPPALWAEGGSRMLDYGSPGGSLGGAPGRPAVLLVPSLVNRAHLLDLMPGASLLRFLAGEGLRPLQLDWGAPGEAERGFTLTDYVAGRLERALAAAAGIHGGPVVLAGYCMGGLLALAAALRRPDRVAALALLATPWDFWAESPARARALAGLLPALEPLMAASGTLPVDALQALFAVLDPFAVAERFRAFGRQDPADPRAVRLVALEDWLNDGVPLAAPVARECLAGWYGRNTPATGAWRIAGEAVEPARLSCPAFLAVPARDRIVPPPSAVALHRLLPPGSARLHQAEAGHVGMAAGSRAEEVLWRPLRDWIGAL